MLDIVRETWEDYLAIPIEQNNIDSMCRHERTGRPLGHTDFISQVEQKLGRTLALQKAGTKKKENK